MRFVLCLAVCTALGLAQSPPVLLLNGYQFPPCGNLTAEDTFGQLPRKLRDSGRQVFFFNNCSVSAVAPNPRPTMEELGNALAARIAAIDAPEIDVVAHSMGGLILRTYLSGKQPAGSFRPPVPHKIRKAVFLGTPHFGPGYGQILLAFAGNDPQVRAIVPGSQFILDLNTWNQLTDDLRGIDAISVAGNVSNDGDGLVFVPSAALPNQPADRTRVVPYCHTSDTALALLVQGCRNPPFLANVNGDDHLSWRMIRSFLSGTQEWQSLGRSLKDDLTGSRLGGMLVAARDKDDNPIRTVTRVTAGPTSLEKISDYFYTHLVASGPQNIAITDSASGNLQASASVPAGQYAVVIAKSGPAAYAALPAAGIVPTRTLAPGMFISIYGANLADAPAAAVSLPLPDTLSGIQVFAGNTALGLQFAGPSQINALIPENASGLISFRVRTPGGQQQFNALIEPAVPAIFTRNGAGTGPAAVIRAQTGALITPQSPASAGDILSLYLTGLGATENRGGLEWARLTPKLFLEGVEAQIFYAGRAPGFAGLDQINFAVPAGVGRGMPVLHVESNGRVSNQVTLPLF